ncbi:GNAT family N-acetyltransferase [Haloflavibacter putidus]|uniref:GNAT family N-acetyltransferase n=1 Tax=Haloflavibacter putidus TaxID=2576776 RepID=A0A507ZL55_9FLAO|nr:GNAT family N-acetyltransferase [Haloflavibacter putidus]TQD37727.1 GNAT family N-acetyltransferase [Haloflavibacter putidus]
MLQVQEVLAETVLPIRQEVLRPGKPLSACVFEPDPLASSHHFMLLKDNLEIAIASYFKERHPEFQEEKQYRLRGMAVLPEYHGKSFGKKLLNESLKKLPSRNLVWFNARLKAVGFYKKQGFLPQGEEFEIPGVGLHILMFQKYE